MTAAHGLAPGQIRAVGITLGAIYGFHALRGILTDLALNGINPLQGLVNLLAWLPAVVALVAFIARKVRVGQQLLLIGGLTYPIAVILWPLVAEPGPFARIDFWIHQIPGMAAVALLMTTRLWIATASLFVYSLLVEGVMRTVGIVEDWRSTLVRAMFAIVYSGFFFIMLLAMVKALENTNRVLDRSAREQSQAAMMQARSDEIGRLDRLTHDFVLSLLSSAAEGVPSDKLQIQAETVRRQLDSGFPDTDEDGTLADVAERIERRSVRRGVPVEIGGSGGEQPIPRGAAVEIEAAVEEAVRNAVRHATGGRTVTVTYIEGGVRVVVSDTGPGFVMERIGERLGVHQSILARMNSLAGGSATIDSEPGRATCVTITWRGGTS